VTSEVVPPRGRGCLDVMFVLLALLALLSLIGAVAVPNWLAARAHGRESRARHLLRDISSAQTIFRECDKDRDGELDYGTLDELAAYGLVDPDLADGRVDGYRFDVFLHDPGVKRNDAELRDYLWMVTATPEKAFAGPGTRTFAMNQAGVVYYAWQREIPGSPDGTIPDFALPIG
jgi:type II secretory pathway pseudopilin PulG